MLKYSFTLIHKSQYARYKGVILLLFSEAAKTVLLFSGPVTKRGGGGERAWPLRKKKLLFEAQKKYNKKMVAGP